MQYDRYYYSILNNKEKEVYKLIYKGIENLDASIKIPAKYFIGVDLGEIIQKILLDNPHIFYVDRNGYRFTSLPLYTTISFNYLYNAKEIAELRTKINNAVNSMLKRVTGNTDYEKEKSVHDLICKNVTYTYDALSHNKKYSSVSNTILGVLFYKTAVCEGVALTVKLLLNMLDIKCMVAFGYLDKVYHAWNIVKIDGQNYHIDVTNDIGNTIGSLRYVFFNLNDNEISFTHKKIYNMPACNDSVYNYFVKEKLVVKTKADLLGIVSKAKSHCVMFKYVGFESLDKIISYTISILNKPTCRFYKNDALKLVYIYF